ncbi:RES domain-containing protein [Kocuria varians]|nr:RES domain-containing protein [Kocuria varians]
MKNYIRQIPVDGRTPPMSDEEFAAVVAQAGDPAMFGDWYTKSVKSSNGAGEGEFTGRISIDLSDYLNAFFPGEIEKRIKAVQEQLPHVPDSETVRKLVTDALTPDGWSSLVRPFSIARIPAWSTYLYRVRPGLHGPEDIKTVGDIWTPPTGTSPGRVNRRGQPILYTSAQYPSVAFRESRAKVGEVVALSCFAITDDLNLLNLDDMSPQGNLNTSQQRKWRQLAKFYRWAFRDSGSDLNSPQHLVPQVLTLDLNMLIPPLVGYGYQSVIVNHHAAINVALDEQKAMDHLRLVGTTVWRIGKPTSMLLASMVPKHPRLTRDTPLVPGNFAWPPDLEVTQRSYQSRA